MGTIDAAIKQLKAFLELSLLNEKFISGERAEYITKNITNVNKNRNSYNELYCFMDI
jgi:hypothetical protein